MQGHPVVRPGGVVVLVHCVHQPLTSPSLQSALKEKYIQKNISQEIYSEKYITRKTYWKQFSHGYIYFWIFGNYCTGAAMELQQKHVKILRGGRITEDTDLLLLDRRGGEELDGEGAEGVEGEDVLPDRGDTELPVGLGPRLWPVLVTLDLQLFIISR